MTSEAKALGKGYVRYLTARMGTSKLEVSATIAEPWAKPALQLWKYINSGVDGRVPGLLYLDFTEANGKQHYASIAVAGEDKIKNLLTAVGRGEDPADVTERFRRQQYDAVENPATRNGLHHADSPHNWPADWDDFTGAPWGFISPKGEIINGIDEDEQVDNHDALAMGISRDLKRSPHPEDDALWKGYIRFITFMRDGAWMLGVTAASNKGRHDEVAKRILKAIPQFDLPFEVMEVDIFTTNTPYGSQKSVMMKFDRISKVVGALKRVAAGEDPETVRETTREENPYVFSPGVSHFGIVSPDGKLHRAGVNDITHDDIAARLVKHTSTDSPLEMVLDRGYIRYFIEADGDIYMEARNRSKDTLRAAVKALEQMPHSGEVTIDFTHGEAISARSVKDATVKAKAAMRERNPYAFSKHVTRFGFIKPNAAVVNAKKDEMAHQEVAQRLGFPTEHAALSKGGLVRFLVYKDGQSDMEIDTPLDKVAGAIKGFVTKSPDINGIVTLDAPTGHPVLVNPRQQSQGVPGPHECQGGRPGVQPLLRWPRLPVQAPQESRRPVRGRVL